MVNSINNKELTNKYEEIKDEVTVSVDKYKEGIKKFNGRDTYITKTLFKKDGKGGEDHIYCSNGKYNHGNNQFSSLEFAENLIEEMLHFEDLYVDYKGNKYYPLRDEVKQLKEETKKDASLIEKQKEEIKALEKNREGLQRELKEAGSEGDTHIEAMKFGLELVETQTKKLEEELENEKDIVQSFVKRHAEKIVEFDKLQESWNEEHEKVRKETQKNTDKDEVIRQLKEEIYLNTKPLPKTPSKFRILKEKTKTKFKHLIEKTKHKSQELIARIEVKVK